MQKEREKREYFLFDLQISFFGLTCKMYFAGTVWSFGEKAYLLITC
jgi:hypothetical protein